MISTRSMLAAATAALLQHGVAVAGTGDGYTLTSGSITAGEGIASGGGYEVIATAAEPVTGSMGGGDYEMEGSLSGGEDAPPPEPEPCPGDTDGSGIIDVNDLLEVILAWGVCAGPCPADVNDDEVVDVNDLLVVILAWGPCV